MVKEQINITINRPVADVFAYVADPRNNPKWQDGLKGNKVVPDGPAQVGTKVTDERTFLGMKMEPVAEVIALEPNKNFSLKSVSGPFPFQVTASFEGVTGGTKLTFDIQMEAGGFFKLAEGKVASNLKESLEKSFQTLKKQLEG